MADAFDLQVLNDGHRNAIVRLSAVLDTADANLMPAITLDTFTNNDKTGVFSGLRLDQIDHVVGEGLQVLLYWSAAVDQLIYTCAGHHTTCFKQIGGLVPDMTKLGYNGAIDLKTIGFNQFQVPPQSFSLVLQFVKLYR